MQTLVLALLATATLAGATHAQPPEAPTESDKGKTLFAGRCQSCHGEFASNAPTFYTLGGYKPEAIVDALKNGKMQPLAAGLSDDDMSAIAKFIVASRPAN